MQSDNNVGKGSQRVENRKKKSNGHHCSRPDAYTVKQMTVLNKKELKPQTYLKKWIRRYRCS